MEPENTPIFLVSLKEKHLQTTHLLGSMLVFRDVRILLVQASSSSVSLGEFPKLSFGAPIDGHEVMTIGELTCKLLHQQVHLEKS